MLVEAQAPAELRLVSVFGSIPPTSTHHPCTSRHLLTRLSILSIGEFHGMELMSAGRILIQYPDDFASHKPRGRGGKRHALNFCPNFLFARSKEREREIRKGVREVAEIEDVDTLHNRLRYDILIHMCVFSVYHSNTCRIAASWAEKERI